MGVFTMPSLGADMEAGTLTEWLVAPGDTVKRGDIVAVVETQKGAIEIEIFESGTVERLEAEIGQKLPVGAPLALIRGEGEPAAEPPPAPAPTAAEPQAAPPAPDAATAASPARPATPAPLPPAGIAASPAARALAAERGIDLAGLTGTGPGGAIVLADVDAAAAPDAAQVPVEPESASDPRAEMRKAIAAAMAKSKREIPHYYLFHRIDLQAATDWLAETNAARPPERRLLMGALLAKATARAAHGAKAVNGHYGPEGFRPADSVHLGMAVVLRGGGLIAPAIRDAQTLTLDEMMAAMRDVVARARAGRLRSSELTDGTLTLSSLGEKGVEAMAGIIYPPQVALVGFGTPAAAPAARGGQVALRETVTASLAADHRASDGRVGAKFLAEIDQRLQHPEEL
ncbi:pyruvate dehydrogenase E2 component (dihydrolipoamide acetyltransferase) [Rhodovulum sp. ES.010]|uniref:dihydrolipoamide acetyltransferase family protein n=1 Tax=Rhodovulum sp. ES.010 TaxID=1882821 RepID=UPI00092B5932|nr:dihydrolipoamide acetyltransferase family protein [Rhodovulum sp. ES.010]SIO04076.1 pyruvate dehydrogenase E2 component (dihydrolipoamide acetyltransferase) [Rhodovulum sp. ES.010]